MLYAICDKRDLRRPYVFQAQDRGFEEPAIYAKESRAKEMAEKMNSLTSITSFVVREISFTDALRFAQMCIPQTISKEESK